MADKRKSPNFVELPKAKIILKYDKFNEYSLQEVQQFKGFCNFFHLHTQFYHVKFKFYFTGLSLCFLNHFIYNDRCELNNRNFRVDRCKRKMRL
jgi:hypothetical protein